MSIRQSPSGGALTQRVNHGWRCVVCALAMIALVAPVSASAQELWRGLQAGASPEAVRQAFPDAAPPLALATLADGETDDLVTHGLFWDDRLMEVRFFFQEQKLETVQLSPVGVAASRSQANLALAHSLADALTDQYGAPYECGDKTFADIGLFECKWLRQPITVRLWYEDAAGQAPSLRIVFRKAGDIAYDF
jgi:hypothetical protein